MCSTPLALMCRSSGVSEPDRAQVRSVPAPFKGPCGSLPGGGWTATLSAMSDPFVVLPGQGHPLDMGTFQAEVLATSGRTSGEFSMLMTRNEPHGFGPPLHLHRDAAEAFFVLEGEYLIFLGEDRQLCPPGTFVYVPRGIPHTFQVTSATPGRKLNLFTPAAMVGFFEDLAAAETAGRATPELLGRIAEQHGMDVLGPVPEAYL